jgi:hypothetical protein
MRIICNRFAVALFPQRLNTDECAEIDAMKATSADRRAFSLILELSWGGISSESTSTPMAMSAREKISWLPGRCERPTDKTVSL